MNKLGIFGVTFFICLLFVDLAASTSIRFRDSLNARLVVRKNQLGSSSAAGNLETQINETPKSSSSNLDQLGIRIEESIVNLRTAQKHLQSLLIEAKKVAQKVLVEKVESEIRNESEQIEKAIAEAEMRKKAERAIVRIVNDPNNQREFVDEFKEKVKEEIIKEETEKRIATQVGKELLDDLNVVAIKAENLTREAEADVQRKVGIAVKGVIKEITNAGSVQKKVANEVKEQVAEVIVAAQNKYNDLLNASTTSPPSSSASSSPLPENQINEQQLNEQQKEEQKQLEQQHQQLQQQQQQQQQTGPKNAAGLVQVETLKKLRQQFKKSK